MSSSGLKSWSRSRWAAIGAAVAVSLGAGGLLTASAAGSPAASSFVPITPCRLMDTRAGTTNIGPRATPINQAETYAALVWGTNGNCTIPSSATAVTMNVTFVNPSQSGFVTVYPPDKPNPGTSNLNFVAGQAPAPNAVTSPLSATGSVGFFNNAGTVDVIADIVGYFEPSGSGSGSGSQGPAGPPGPQGIPGWGTIPSGVTVTGLSGMDSAGVTGAADHALAVSLPARAPAGFDDGQINFAGTAAVTSDDDPSCTGTATNPTAPPGQICLYLYGSNAGVTNLNGGAAAAGDRLGFWIYWNETGAAGGDMFYFLTWAYTAP